MSIKVLKTEKLTWINIEGFDSEAEQYLKENFRFHQLDIKDCRGESQQPKLDIYKKYIFAIFHFPYIDTDRNVINSSELNVFIGPDYLVTVQKRRLKILKECFYKCLNSKKFRIDFSGKGSAYLLYRLLELLFRSSKVITSRLSLNITKLEEEIYESGQGSKSVVQRIAILRRNILNFRKILNPQRFVVNSLVNLRNDFINEDISFYFDDIHDYIEKSWAILDNQQELAQALQETNETMINHRTNRIIGLLTIISVAMMPLTLLTGIYGMNVQGLPYANHPIGVWMVFAVMAIFLLGIAFYFKRREKI